jgi:hypothetical protein
MTSKGKEFTPLDSERFSRVEERIRKRSRSPLDRREHLRRSRRRSLSRSLTRELLKKSNLSVSQTQKDGSGSKYTIGCRTDYSRESPLKGSRHISKSRQQSDLKNAIKKLRALEEKVSFRSF